MLALVAQVVLTLRDETDSLSTLRLYVRSSTSPAAALEAAAGLATLLRGLSGCVCDEISLTYREIITPSSNPSRLHNPYGVFIFDTAAPEAYFIAAIPGLKPALLKPTPDEMHIDVQHADVAAFISMLTGGLFINPFTDDIASINEAYIQYRIHSGRYIP